jgi:ATP-dependent helicase/nuclease subunit A
MAREWMAIEERVPDTAAAGLQQQLASPAKQGVSTLLQSILAAVNEAPRAATWLVAPSRRVARQWLDSIALAGTPVFNVRATTPRALCYDLAAATLAARGVTVASRRAALVLLEKAIVQADQAGELRCFSRPRSSRRSYRRLAERMLASLTAIRMAGLAADDIRGRSGFGDTPKGHDLALLLERYAAELAAAKLVDAADVAATALSVVAGSIPPGWERILVPEGLALEPLERRLFEALAPRVQTLAIDPEPESFADTAHGPTPHFFRAIGEANEIRGVLRRCLAAGLPLDTVELLHTDAATYPPLIQEVLAVMAAESGGEAAATRDLPVTFADGLPIRESRTARALAAWLRWRDEGYPQWLLVRMLRDGLLDWRRVERKINGQPPQADPAAAPDATAETADEEPAEDGSSGDAQVTHSRLLRELRRLRIGHDLGAMPATIRAAVAAAKAAPLESFAPQGRDADEEAEIDEEAAARWRSQRIAALEVLAGVADELVACELRPGARCDEVVAAAEKFLADLAAARSQFDNNAKNRLRAEIAEMKQWLGQHPEADARDVVEWLAGLTDTLVVMGSAPRPGCLHVASIATGGHSGRPHTFVVGLDEGRFPGPGRSDPVLPDTDRAALSDSLELTAAAAGQTRTEFWRLLGRLRGDVHLSYPCRELVEQSELFPSPLLLEVYRRSEAAPGATLAEFIAAVAGETESFVPRDVTAALGQTEWWLAQLGESPSLPAVRQAIRGHGPLLAQGLAAVEARRSAAFTPWDGNVPDAGPKLDPASPEGRIASAHSLETLGGCPRRFFFRYGLDIQPLDSLEPDADRWLDHKEEGSVLHEVLEKFMRPFLYTGPGRPSEAAPRPTFTEHEGRILEILDEVLAAKRAEKPSNDEAAVAAGRRELAESVRTFLRVEEQYCSETGSRPVALEAAIGYVPEGDSAFDREQPVALRLGNEGRTVRLRGRIDRIDRDGREDVEQGYMIIDYKKGSSSRFKQGGVRDPLGVFHKGRRLQHGLYVLMVRHAAAEAGCETSHVNQFAYLFPGSKTLGERLEWTAPQLEQVDEMVGKLCDIAAAGAFLPTNVAADCGFCDFLDVCGDPAATTRDASRKLTGDSGKYGAANKTLAELFAGVREARDPAPAVGVVRPQPLDFKPGDEPPPDDLQDATAREAIRTDLAASMLVEASAGTGKTTCLVDRMTALVRTGTATVGQIAAITFTKKAAAELARRFRERLERDVAHPDTLPADRERLHAALAEIDSAMIGTVHSFCGRLLRERPIEAGLDPSVETLDGPAEQTLRDRAWRQFCDRVGREDVLTGHRQALEEAGLDLRDLRDAFVTFVAHGDVRDWPHAAITAPDIGGLLEEICGEIETQRETVDPTANKDKLLTKLEGFLRAYRMRPDDSPASLFRAAEQLAGKCPTITQRLWLPGAGLQQRQARQAELENWWATLVARIEPLLSQWHAYRYQFVIPLLAAARDHYEQVRLDEGVLSFQDLLARTAALLRTRPDVRVAFAKRHPFLLVDEFQDTDPLQAEMLLLLTAVDDNATNWRETTIKPGSLFVVGDPKQSIYRFRRADIDTFEFVKQRIAEPGGEVLHLQTNFRTNRELVSWVNERFGDRFATHRPAGAPAYGPDFSASHVGRRTGVAGCLTGLRQLRVKKGNVEAEAEAVAQFIRRAIDHRLTVPRTSAAENPACRPEDFLIVTWDTGELSTYAAALNAVGLPCDVTGRKGMHSQEDLAQLQLCLRVVADADDTVAALAVLRGPLFGFSDAELFDFRAAGGRIDGRLHVPKALEKKDEQKDLTDRLRTAADSFRRWRKLAGSLPLAAALERIAGDAGLLLVASEAGGRAGRRGRAAAGTIATFIERVRAERTLLTSVQDVVDRLEELVAAGTGKQDFDTLSIDATAGGAVRVMNLHKVKGLEAPVVFLCDDNGPKRDRSPSWHVSRSAEEVRGYLRVSRTGPFGSDGGTLAAPEDWAEHETVETRYLEAEYLRLNYVAGTRPGTCLVASVFEDSNGEITGGWHELDPDVAAVPNLPDLGPHAEAEQARAEAAARPPADEAGIAAARQAAAARLAAVQSPTFATVTPRDFLTEPAEQIRHTGRGLGQDWGTIIHRLLELAVLDLAAGSPPLDLHAAAASLVEESDLAETGVARESLARRAVALVEQVRGSDVWRRIVASPERHVEVPFSIAIEGKEIPADVAIDRGPAGATGEGSNGGGPAAAGSTTPAVPVLIRGQIDAVFHDTATSPPAGMSEWVIVDWKTTSVADSDVEKLVEHYRPQLRLYARCWATGLASRLGDGHAR